MTPVQFKNMIAKYGEGNLAAIVMDNSARKVFAKFEFTLAANYDDTIGSITILETDPVGNEYLNVKHVENIQGLVFATANTKKAEIDTRLMSS